MGWGSSFVYGEAVSAGLRRGPATAGSVAWAAFRTLNFWRKVWVAYVSLLAVLYGFHVVLEIGIGYGRAPLDIVEAVLTQLLVLVAIPRFTPMAIRILLPCVRWLRDRWIDWIESAYD